MQASRLKTSWPWWLFIALPTCIAVSRPPVTVFYNTAACVLAAGVLLYWMAVRLPASQADHGVPSRPFPSSAGLRVPVLGALLLIGALAASVLHGGRNLAALGVVSVAFSLAVMADHWGRSQRYAEALDGIAGAWLAAGLVGLLIGALQYADVQGLPTWLVATSATAGRAVGNLRQPNHLSTLLALGLCSLLWLGHRRGWELPALLTLQALLVLGIVLSSSRTGLLMLVLLAAWALLDRRLPRRLRVMLLATVPAALAWTAAVHVWSEMAGVRYFAEARLASNSDISSSRFAIWKNTLDLIAQHPWTGVGWNNFNYAWTLTPFPDRPVAFFDHTHNVLLQLAVELGLPAAMAIVGGVCWATWRARHGCRQADDHAALASRVLLAVLVMVALHSLLEYPLWYPYFLLPTALAFGLYLGLGRPAESRPASGLPRGLRTAVETVALLTVATALYAVWDYQRIVQIFSPHGEAGQQPLSERIRDGQRSVLFGHHADYAAVTTTDRPGSMLGTFQRPLHQLIDARLMIAYARALHERGETEKAIYVAQRLREFRHPLGQVFFAPCDTPPAAGEAPPFQCETRPSRLGLKDLGK